MDKLINSSNTGYLDIALYEDSSPDAKFKWIVTSGGFLVKETNSCTEAVDFYLAYVDKNG